MFDETVGVPAVLPVLVVSCRQATASPLAAVAFGFTALGIVFVISASSAS
jgi:hypothetical protein